MAERYTDAPMTPDEFNAIADRRGWSRRYLATQLGTGSTTIDNWGTGRASVPPSVAEWLRIVDRLLAALPPPRPEQWRRQPGRSRKPGNKAGTGS